MERRRSLALGAGVVSGFYLQTPSLVSGQVVKKKMEKKKSDKKLPLKISLAQWSLNKRLFSKQEPKLDNLDFAKEARSMGIKAVEYVNQFFIDKAKDTKYLARMKKRDKDNGVKSLLIMCDGEGNLGDPDTKRRTQAVENHYKWIEAAKFLGYHSVSVNARSKGSYEEQLKLTADGLWRLIKYEGNRLSENDGILATKKLLEKIREEYRKA
jgi:sugar phosphate isomerase/epimerase